MNDNSYRVIEVDINEILPNRFQPRIQFDEEEILELSDSIKEHGVIQPIVVRTIGDKYEIIAGERRYKASVLAGKETVPVIIKNLNDKDSAEIALIENIQRKNLTPIEEALSYKKILDMGYITQDNLASKLGKSQSSVANKIRLLNLSDEVQEALLDNKISERHARSLLRIKSLKDQNNMLERIVKERLTVRKTDEAIDKLLNGSAEENPDNDEKIIEKGERDMINEIPSVPVAPMPSTPVIGGIEFDANGNVIAAPTGVAEIPSVPVAPMPSTPVIGGIEFDANGNVIAAPTGVAEIPSVPVAPMPSTPVIGGIEFDANGNVIAAPTGVAEIPSVPVAPMPSTPVIGGIEFDANGNVIAAPTGVAEIPSVPLAPMPSTSVIGGIEFDASGNVIAAPTGVAEIPSVPVAPMPSTSVIGGIEFDASGNVIAAPTGVAEIPSVPVAPMPSTPVIGGIEFDANGNVIAAPTGVAEIPSVPVAPMPSTPVIGGIEFDANGNVIAAPTGVAEIPSVPVAPMPSTPVIGGIEFDANGNVIAAPTGVAEIPTMTPIIESSSENEISNNQFENNLNESIIQTPVTQNENIINQPIIVTDYSKQYDPVMPNRENTQLQVKNDFKEIVNIIRECSQKIEQYGYKIDVEEYDLSTLYQVVFKIEK